MRSASLLLLFFAAFLGCADDSSAAPDGAVTDQELVGGAAAKSAAYDAVGALVHAESAKGPPTVFFCTATLVAPDVVLTAKHCLTQDATGGFTFLDNADQPVYFTIGADALKPKRTIRLERAKVAPLADGGYASLGADVALAYLAEKVTDITPWKVDGSRLAAANLGQPYTAVGFGVRDEAGNAGQRKVGRLTLQATAGQPLHKLFPRLTDFQAYLTAKEGAAWVTAQDARIRKFYDVTLLRDYEAYLGAGPKDVQPCNGDSGGPIVTRVSGANVVVGVVSASFKGPMQACGSVGEVYATFGPRVRELFAGSVPGYR